MGVSATTILSPREFPNLPQYDQKSFSFKDDVNLHISTSPNKAKGGPSGILPNESGFRLGKGSINTSSILDEYEEISGSRNKHKFSSVDAFRAFNSQHARKNKFLDNKIVKQDTVTRIKSRLLPKAERNKSL